MMQWEIYENLVLAHSILLATDTFQHQMHLLFADMLSPPIIYIDDLLCHSIGTFEEHLEITDMILTSLATEGMQINAKTTS